MCDFKIVSPYDLVIVTPVITYMSVTPSIVRQQYVLKIIVLKQTVILEVMCVHNIYCKVKYNFTIFIRHVKHAWGLKTQLK